PRKQDRVALAPATRNLADVGDETDAADHRRGGDRPPVGLVVERDVPRDDGDVERLGGRRDALDRLGELPADLRFLRIAEVEAVREADPLSARAGDVACGADDRLGARAERASGEAGPLAAAGGH